MDKKLIAVCFSCGKLRNKDDDHTVQSNWVLRPVPEGFELSHGICPACIKILYPGFYKNKYANVQTSA